MALYILNTEYFILRRKRREWLPKSPKPEAHVETFDEFQIELEFRNVSV